MRAAVNDRRVVSGQGGGGGGWAHSGERPRGRGAAVNDRMGVVHEAVHDRVRVCPGEGGVTTAPFEGGRSGQCRREEGAREREVSVGAKGRETG